MAHRPGGCLTLVACIMAKNEAAPDRYLARVLARCAEFSDATLVLDDGSTDDTVEIARRAGCVVKQRPKAGAWGNESPARAELWERGAKLAKDGWLLICDADMLLQGDPRPLAASWECNAWAFALVDLWDSERSFRVDGPWAGGPTQPRPWLFLPSACPQPTFGTRGIHVGHFPTNFPLACLPAPPDIYWQHLAYVKREHRVAKHAQYMTAATQLTEFELAHAASILD